MRELPGQSGREKQETPGKNVSINKSVTPGNVPHKIKGV